MERTAELIRLYVTDTIDSVLAFRKDAEERRKRDRERAVRQRHRKAGLDLSNISFSEEDVRRILIPAAITGTEDTVIAYCLKYWNRTGDPAFEKTVLLYSRKYRTRHYEIFSAIKNGRDHGWKDEEILNAVLANVVTGYYYSISGDLYLQRTWARYKAKLDGGAAAATPPAYDDARPAPTEASELAEAAAARAKTRRVRPAAPARVRKAGKETRAREEMPQRERAKKTVPAPKAPKAEAKRDAAQKGLLKKAKNVRAEYRPGSHIRTAKIPAANSIADMIRKETGKTYTVYKDLFFKGIRPSIREILVGSGKKANIFSSRQNEAEEIIYGFLYEQYDRNNFV